MTRQAPLSLSAKRRSRAALPAVMAAALLVSLLPAGMPAVAAAELPVAAPASELAPPGDEPPPLPQPTDASPAGLAVPPPVRPPEGPGEAAGPLPAPGSEPAPSALEQRTADRRLVAPDPSQVTRGTPFWREWRNADGSHTAQISTQPVFRQSAEGGWRLVDLTAAAPADHDSRRPSAARLADRAAPGMAVVRLDSPAGEFALTHPEATGDAAGQATGNRTGRRYDDALSGGRDLIVERTANGFKQSVIAPAPTEQGHSYLLRVNVPAGVTATPTASGAVQLVDADGQPLALFGGGIAYDAAERFAQTPVTVRLVAQDARDVTIEVGVDPAWFRDPTRVFPVTIDPQWDWQQNGLDECASPTTATGQCDVYVDSDYPSPTQPSYWQVNELRLGSPGAYEPNSTDLNRTRSYLKFPTGDLSGNGYKVKYARVAIGTAYAASDQTRYYDLYAAAQAPTRATNWSNQPARAGSPVGRAPVTGIDWLIWDSNNSPGVTALAQNWFDDAASNAGVRAEAYYERDTNSFRRFYSGNGGATQAPILQVVYVKKPTEPLNPRAIGGDRQITAHWDPPLDWGGPGSRDFITALYDAAGQYVPDTVRSVCSTCYETTYTGLGDLESYRVALYARNEAGNSATVATPYATTNPPPPLRPSAPRNVTATAGDQQATVTWDPPDTDGGTPITDYNTRAYEITDTGDERLVATDGCDDCTQTSHTFTGLTNGTRYRFKVTADNLVGEGPAGTSNDATPSGPPFAPRDVNATPGDTTATVTWSAADDNGATIDSYRVEARNADDDTEVGEVTVPGGDRTAQVGGLDNGTDHYLTVTAHNANGDGPSAASASVVPSGPPGQPGDVYARPLEGSASVTWSPGPDNGSALTGHRVEVYAGDGTRLPSKDVSVGNDDSAMVPALDNGSEYSFTVTATNANGDGPPSTRTDAVTPDTPLEIDQREPVRAVTTRSDSYAVQGKTALGATVTVHKDDDRDGLADDPYDPVAAQTLGGSTRIYEIVVPLEEGTNRFVVSAQLGDQYSEVVPVHNIIRLPPPAEVTGDQPYKPDTVAVKTTRAADGEATMQRLQADGVIQGYAPAFTYQDGSEATDPILRRWYEAQVPVGQAEAVVAVLKADAAVAVAETIPIHAPDQAGPNDPLRDEQDFLDRVGAPGAWAATTTPNGNPGTRDGDPVRIAVIDDEFDLAHPDLQGDAEALIPHTDGCEENPAMHGTPVAGLASASTNNGVGISGVGFDARIVPVQSGVDSAPDDPPSCGISGAATNELMALADGGVEVANLSFGSLRRPRVMEREAIRYATNRGMLVVASAGNGNTDQPHYPSSYPEVLSVAALDAQDDRAGFSNFGPDVDLSAPGTREVSLRDRRGPCFDGFNAVDGAPDYCEFGGTSAASPIVAGGVALVTASLDGPGGLRARHRLMDAVVPLAGVPEDMPIGEGRANFAGAVSDRAVRLDGPSRNETAEQVTQEAFPVAPGARENVIDRVVLVPDSFELAGEGDVAWRDTLPAAGLVGRDDTALVLSTREELHPSAEAELARLLHLDIDYNGNEAEVQGLPAPAQDDDRRIVIVGSEETSFTEAFEDRLENRFPGRVTRIEGVDPDPDDGEGAPLEPGGPARAAAALADAIVDGRTVSEALLVTSEDFADAIPMAGVATTDGLPLLFTGSNALPDGTCEWLQGHADVQTLHIAGGVAAIDSSVEGDLADCTSAQLVRHAGPTRLETAVTIAEDFYPTPETIVLATAFKWPDAVVGGNASHAYDAPILLTNDDELFPPIEQYVDGLQVPDPGGVVLGGVAAIPDAVEQQFEEALR